MAYTGSQAQTGLGTIFAVNTGTSTTPVWTPVGEIRSSSQTGLAARFVDVTNFESPGYSEFLPTVVDPGMWKLTVNRVSQDLGQSTLLTAFKNRTISSFQITLIAETGQTSGDVITFSAYVESYDIDLAAEKETTMNISLKVTGAITLVEGA
ncbi:MAG TPA: phage tail tube protein [Acidobacteriaceae bacterium]|nr:phage tail tube protein [Acidobacteriaceae bacterium]